MHLINFCENSSARGRIEPSAQKGAGRAADQRRQEPRETVSVQRRRLDESEGPGEIVHREEEARCHGGERRERPERRERRDRRDDRRDRRDRRPNGNREGGRR